MLKDKRLSLPNNWETILEQMMLKKAIGSRCERIYICSPCRADTPEGVIRNIKAARIYMFYSFIYFAGLPQAPHAYLSILLSDNNEDERAMALDFGKQYLKGCNRLFVCGDRLSDGMYGEIKEAILLGIDVEVFNENLCEELCRQLENEGLDPEAVCYDFGHLHYALSWGADDLLPYWEVDSNA